MFGNMSGFTPSTLRRKAYKCLSDLNADDSICIFIINVIKMIVNKNYENNCLNKNKNKVIKTIDNHLLKEYINYIPRKGIGNV